MYINLGRAAAPAFNDKPFRDSFYFTYEQEEKGSVREDERRIAEEVRRT